MTSTPPADSMHPPATAAQRTGEVPAVGQSALVAFRQRTKRLTRIYLVAVTVIVAVVLGLVKLAYVRGELSHVSALSAAPPAVIPTAATAAALTLRWHTDDSVAAGTPYAGGIVVTYTPHTVTGRDALTGMIRWHYTRSDETICSVLQQDLSTLAFFNRDGNCDEITGLATATGQRKFLRTIPDSGIPATASASNVVLIVTPAAVHVIDNAGGLDRWTWSPPAGCHVLRALAGSLGVLTSYQCGDQYWLSLHALTDDQQLWNVAARGPLLPLTATAVLAAVDPATGEVTRLAAKDGSLAGQFAVTPLPGLHHLPAAQALASIYDASGAVHELGYDGQIFSIIAPGRRAWSVTADGPPSVSASGTVFAMVNHRAALLNANTGTAERNVSLTPTSTGTTASPVGSGLLITGPGAGASYYG